MFASGLVCGQMLADIRQNAFPIGLYCFYALTFCHLLKRDKGPSFHLLLTFDQYIAEHTEMLVKFPAKILQLRVKFLQASDCLPAFFPKCCSITVCNTFYTSLKSSFQFLKFLAISLCLTIILMTSLHPFIFNSGKGFFQFVCCNRLINIIFYAKSKRPLRIHKFRIATDHNKICIRTFFLRRLDHRQTIQPRNSDIRNYYIRFLTSDHFQSLDSVISSPYYLIIQLQAGN